MVKENLPEVVPEGNIIVEDEPHQFRVVEHDNGSTSIDREYIPNKAPILEVRSLTGTVNGNPYTFTETTDFEVVDADDDGQQETIRFLPDSGVDPDENSTFEVTYTSQSVLSRYVESFEEDLESIDEDIGDTIEASQVNQADRAQLIELGKFFGRLGEPAGRSTEKYRAFLRSLVASFDGRGTVQGLKFAIAAGVGTDPENVVIEEDFETVGYTVSVNDVDSTFLSGVINEMAELADPAGAELLNPPVIVFDDTNIGLEPTLITRTQSDNQLGAETLGTETLGS